MTLAIQPLKNFVSGWRSNKLSEAFVIEKFNRFTAIFTINSPGIARL